MGKIGSKLYTSKPRSTITYCTKLGLLETYRIFQDMKSYVSKSSKNDFIFVSYNPNYYKTEPLKNVRTAPLRYNISFKPII